jgi:hypothetical protein
MPKATRPIFIPHTEIPYYRILNITFEWYPGVSLSQAQKSIASLHETAAKHGLFPTLDVSSKSPTAIGKALSAFNLKLQHNQMQTTLECAFQGSKVFEKGGPFTDLYTKNSYEAKRDPRLIAHGHIKSFKFCGIDFSNEPKTAFYDYLYLLAIAHSPDLLSAVSQYFCFTDIAFNPSKSLNCQARSLAICISLRRANLINSLANHPDKFYETQTFTSEQPSNTQLSF